MLPILARQLEVRRELIPARFRQRLFQLRDLSAPSHLSRDARVVRPLCHLAVRHRRWSAHHCWVGRLARVWAYEKIEGGRGQDWPWVRSGAGEDALSARAWRAPEVMWRAHTAAGVVVGNVGTKLEGYDHVERRDTRNSGRQGVCLETGGSSRGSFASLSYARGLYSAVPRPHFLDSILRSACRLFF